MTDHIIFDNFLVTDDREVHSSWTAQTWQKKISAEHASISGVSVTLCLLGNFFCRLLIFSKSTFPKNSFRIDFLHCVKQFGSRSGATKCRT